MFPNPKDTGKLILLLKKTIRARAQQFRVQIRNREVKQMRQRRRREMLLIQHIQASIQHAPTSVHGSFEWAQNLMATLKQVPNYQIPIDQVMKIFHELERFPYLSMLRLFRIVLLRSSGQAVDEMFQYDILGLMHGIMQRAQTVPTQTHEMADFIPDSQDSKQIQTIRLVLLCLAELCEKAEHVRNFTIINHKSVSKCTKVVRAVGDSIKPQYLAFLKSTTVFPFRRHDQPFFRITNFLLGIFVSHQFHEELNWVGSSNSEALLCSELLIAGMTHLLEMDCGWITQKILHIKGQNEDNYLHSIILLILRQYNAVFSNSDLTLSCEGSQVGLLTETIALSIKYSECFDSSNQIELHQVYYQLMSLLILDPQLLLRDDLIKSRIGIYFSLSNYFSCLTVSHEILTAQFHFYGRQPQINLLAALSRLLLVERHHEAYKELLVLIGKVILSVPIVFLEPFIMPSELLPNIFLRVVGPPLINNDSLSYYSIVSQVLNCLLKQLSKIPGLRQQYKTMLWSQYGLILNEKLSRYFDDRFPRQMGGFGQGQMRQGLELILALLTPDSMQLVL